MAGAMVDKSHRCLLGWCVLLCTSNNFTTFECQEHAVRAIRSMGSLPRRHLLPTKGHKAAYQLGFIIFVVVRLITYVRR